MLWGDARCFAVNFSPVFPLDSMLDDARNDDDVDRIRDANFSTVAISADYEHISNQLSTADSNNIPVLRSQSNIHKIR